MITKKLTSRQKEIIILLVNQKSKVLTISEIANNLNLSYRTVIRDLIKIEAWFIENDFNLVRKSGVGLLLNEDEENKAFILELLDEEKIDISYKKEERYLFILNELLNSKEPIKLFYFKNKLKTSEGTLSNDLIFIESWLKKFDIKIIKKQGLGIYLEGSEKNIRDANINLIYSNYNENQILSIIKNKIYGENPILDLIDKEILIKTETVLFKTKKNLSLSDNSYIGLLVHTTLMIKRILNNDYIVMNDDILNNLSSKKEYIMASEIIKCIEKEFDIVIPKSEVGYIAMHLRGSKLKLSSDDFNLLEELNINKLSKNIISSCSQKFNVDLSKDSTLSDDLLNHLKPAIYRLKMKMEIRNPLLEEIKCRYGDFFNEISSICDLIKNEFEIDYIPDSEIAYITMHIVSSIERNVLLNNNINVVIVCPTGIGASAILATNIKSYFNSINIVDTVSVLDVDDDYIKSNEIDFIISTIDIEFSIDSIFISPFLKSTDKALIDSIVRKIITKKVFDKKHKNIKSECSDKVYDLMVLAKEMINFTQDAVFIFNLEVKNIDELLIYCSNIFEKSLNQREELYIKLKDRNKLSSLYFEEIDILLPHCSFENIDSIKIAFIKLNKKIEIDENKHTDNIVFMLTPDKNIGHSKKILSFVSENLVSNNEFLDSIKDFDEIKIKNHLDLIVTNFYKNKLKGI